MTFRVELSAEAEKEATAVLASLYEQGAGRTGVDWFLAFEDGIASLKSMPNRCPTAPEDAHYPYEIRELRYGRRPHTYRILFTIEGDTVKIITIRHARRQRIQ